jgi:integrase
VSECCELRIKDLDFDQGLVVVRRGKGDKDRATLLAEVGRDELRAHLRTSEALHHADRRAGLAGVWMPDALDRKYPNAGRELGWFWVSSRSCAHRREARLTSFRRVRSRDPHSGSPSSSLS